MNEFTTPDGDAPLHDPILEEGCPRQSLEATRNRALAAGWTIQEIEWAYGPFDCEERKSEK